jgi:hypothetical protein
MRRAVIFHGFRGRETRTQSKGGECFRGRKETEARVQDWGRRGDLMISCSKGPERIPGIGGGVGMVFKGSKRRRSVIFFVSKKFGLISQLISVSTVYVGRIHR